MKKSTSWRATHAVRKIYKGLELYKQSHPTDSAWVSAGGGTINAMCGEVARMTGIDYNQLHRSCLKVGLDTQWLWNMFGTSYSDDHDFDIVETATVLIGEP